MSERRPNKGHASDAIKFLAFMALVGVAVIKLMHWMHEQQAQSQPAKHTGEDERMEKGKEMAKQVAKMIARAMAAKMASKTMSKMMEMAKHIQEEVEEVRSQPAKPTTATRRLQTVSQSVAARDKSKPSPARTTARPVAKPAPVRRTTGKLNQRQQDIYDLLQARGELTMSELSHAIGAGVSSRTLRRDMTYLEKIRLISQSGRTKNSVYKLV